MGSDALARGFAPTTEPAGLLEGHLPWSATSPGKVLRGATGRVADADVDLVEYEFFTQSKGVRHRHVRTAAIVRHARLRGQAVVKPDYPRWGAGYAIVTRVAQVLLIVALSSVILLAALVWLVGRLFGRSWVTVPKRHVDRLLGHKQFDRMYLVHADTDAAASFAVTPQLRDALVAVRFKGDIEVRPGVAFVWIPDARLDDQETLLEALEPIVQAMVPKSSHPMR